MEQKCVTKKIRKRDSDVMRYDEEDNEAEIDE